MCTWLSRTGEPLADIVLSPNTLYLPRGWWHAVTADQGAPSLHPTFGLTTQTGADFHDLGHQPAPWRPPASVPTSPASTPRPPRPHTSPCSVTPS
ncbi:JmjC domain-containing protein [Streptomyces sp. CA-243310]|uniref:JmjC domain-containing protein n=1 Tax=Streptomyces sp. CA-243310 TaxID=3240056 RepID=UPI003D8E475E